MSILYNRHTRGLKKYHEINQFVYMNVFGGGGGHEGPIWQILAWFNAIDTPGHEFMCTS